MVLDVILITITLIALLVASYSDIRTREVPDWLNYGLIFTAFGIRAIFSINLGWEIILSGILGFIVCFGFALLFYYTGQWGGGDSKLLMGIGAVIGITFPFNDSSWDLLFFFIALLLFGAIFGLLWMVYIAIKKRKVFSLNFKKSISKKKKLHISLAVLSLILIVPTIFYIFLWPLILFPLVFFYLLIFVNSVEKSCFINKVKIKNLTEGDWLAEDLKIKNKLVLEKKTLELEDLWKLRKLEGKGKLTEVLIKEGVPFVPIFLLAYLAIIFVDYFFNLFTLLKF